MPVRQGPHDLQAFARRHEAAAAQRGAQRCNLLRRPIRQVRKRAVFDLDAIAIALPQQNRGTRGPVGNDRDVHAQLESLRFAHVKA
jgi:hypothetical protein